MPAAFVTVNLVILAAVVFTNHDPEAFMGLFLLFLGLAEAYWPFEAMYLRQDRW